MLLQTDPESPQGSQSSKNDRWVVRVPSPPRSPVLKGPLCGRQGMRQSQASPQKLVSSLCQDHPLGWELPGVTTPARRNVTPSGEARQALHDPPTKTQVCLLAFPSLPESHSTPWSPGPPFLQGCALAPREPNGAQLGLSLGLGSGTRSARPEF